MKGIRRDHVARYEFASERVSGHVIDVACGVAYGASILADAGCTVFAVDKSEGALDYGAEHYRRDAVALHCADASQMDFPKADAAVSFETIEHLENPMPMLRALRSAAPVLIASVPNEAVFPHRSNTFHFRHYTRAEFGALLRVAGWDVVEWYGQSGAQSEVEPEIEGRTLIAVAVHGKGQAMKDEKIIYEPHPVSPERKAELRQEGYTILDAVYAPSDVVTAATETPEAITPEDVDSMKRAELVDVLEAHGVENATGKVADLRRWVKRVMFADL